MADSFRCSAGGPADALERKPSHGSEDAFYRCGDRGRCCDVACMRSVRDYRTIGYKWLQRYLAEGVGGLQDRSRAPHAHGRASAEEVVATALALRDRYPHWGAKKLRVKLGALMPEIVLPAASTIGDWLRKEGLTEPRRRRRRSPPFTQ